MRRTGFPDINKAYTNSIYPDENPPFGWTKGARTQYDINLPGIHNSTNPAIFLADSFHRVTDRYPSPNNYSLQLPNYKDVVSIELIHANIPNSAYLINNNYNILHFSEDDDQNLILRANLSLGDWTPEELASNIQTSMNNISNVQGKGYNYVVDYDSNTQKFNIKELNGNNFNLHFEGETHKVGPSSFDQNRYIGDTQTSYIQKSVGPIIGFPRKDFTDSDEYISPYIFNPNVDKYIVLKIRGLDRIDSQGDSVQGAFATIPLDTKSNTFSLSKNCGVIDNDRYVKYFQQPLVSFDSLDISIFDSFGNPYQFNGIDHCMTFEVHSLTRTSQYVHESTGIKSKDGCSFEEQQLSLLNQLVHIANTNQPHR